MWLCASHHADLPLWLPTQRVFLPCNVCQVKNLRLPKLKMIFPSLIFQVKINKHAEFVRDCELERSCVDGAVQPMPNGISLYECNHLRSFIYIYSCWQALIKQLNTNHSVLPEVFENDWNTMKNGFTFVFIFISNTICCYCYV